MARARNTATAAATRTQGNACCERGARTGGALRARRGETSDALCRELHVGHQNTVVRVLRHGGAVERDEERDKVRLVEERARVVPAVGERHEHLEHRLDVGEGQHAKLRHRERAALAEGLPHEAERIVRRESYDGGEDLPHVGAELSKLALLVVVLHRVVEVVRRRRWVPQLRVDVAEQRDGARASDVARSKGRARRVQDLEHHRVLRRVMAEERDEVEDAPHRLAVRDPHARARELEELGERGPRRAERDAHRFGAGDDARCAARGERAPGGAGAGERGVVRPQVVRNGDDRVHVHLSHGVEELREALLQRAVSREAAADGVAQDARDADALDQRELVRLRHALHDDGGEAGARGLLQQRSALPLRLHGLPHRRDGSGGAAVEHAQHAVVRNEVEVDPHDEELPDIVKYVRGSESNCEQDSREM